MNNIVIRQCSNGHYGEQESNFSYLGDGVWSCHACCSKYTSVKEIIDPDKTVGKEEIR